MKAVVINEYGASNLLHVESLPKPKAESHDVLIRIHASGINPMDYKIREGTMKLILSGDFPKVLGAECAGVVEEVGEMVTSVKAGDRVVASLGASGGGYAEYVIAQDKNLVKIPDEVDFDTAATMVVGGLTALHALRDYGKLRPDERVLINGASGGVGVFAVQLARILGGQVTAVCSVANSELVRSLGAHQVINHETTDFTKGVEKYKLIFDAVGKSSFGECRDVLTEDGIYVSTLPSPKQILQNLASTFTSQKSESFIMKFNQEDMSWLLKLAAEGQLKSVIDRTYPLEGLQAAHDYSESGKVKGKLVVEVTSPTNQKSTQETV